MKREQWWPIGLVLTLALTVGANVILVIAANRGDGAAVEPDYYRRAVAWDSSTAEEQRSRALGWTMVATLDAPGASGGAASMHLTIADAHGMPVEGARVRVDGYALARSAATRTDTVLAESDGAYRTRVPVRRVEWYEFRVTADRGPSRYVATLRCLPGLVCREA